MRRFLTMLLLLPVMAVAALAYDDGFRYKEIAVDAYVHKDNTWDITMTQTVQYNEPRHGVYIFVPYRFEMKQPVESASASDTIQRLMSYRAYIDDVAVTGYKYEEYDEDDSHVIKIGDKDELVADVHRYVIRYRYRYPDDRTTVRDCISHSILGTAYQAPTDRFKYSIRFEKPLPEGCADSLRIFSGPLSSTRNVCEVTAAVTPDGISGEAVNIGPANGVTLYMPMPEGYFESVRKASALPMIAAGVVAAVLFVLIMIIALTRRHPTVTKQIEFYPPEGINSAEVGTIIDGTVDTIDIASLIPWLASQGHITIDEREGKGILGSKKKLCLTLVKPLPDDAPKYLRNFVDALFGNEETVCLGKNKRLGENLLRVMGDLDRSFSGKRSLEKVSLWLMLYPLYGAATFAFFLFSSQVELWSPSMFLLTLLVWFLPAIAAWSLLIWLRSRRYVMKHSSLMMWHIVMAAAFVADVALYMLMAPDDTFMPREVALLAFVLGYAANIVVGRFGHDTEYRASLMGKLLGLKEFIETAEKDRLETLLESDPRYFYRIMPYALVFGLTDKWSEHFKTLAVEQPEWFKSDSNTLFTAAYLSTMTKSVCDTSSAAITSSMQAVSSAASSSSGGFSGGGGGGGGGGSW